MALEVCTKCDVMTHNLYIFIILHENIEVAWNSRKHCKEEKVFQTYTYTYPPNAQQDKSDKQYQFI